MVQVVFGAQWGDEGKGKIVDLLSQNADFTVRYHGGNNAGHTVINAYGKFPLHLVPSGIFNPKTISCISSGTVVDLEGIIAEISLLEKAVPGISKRLMISPRCHVIMPYHKLLDRAFEAAKGKAAHGTTGRGIGPVYADKVSYNGIQLADLMQPENFRIKLETALLIKNKIISALGEQPLDLEHVYQQKLAEFSQIKAMVSEPYPVLHAALKKKKTILCEGAQGFFLDNDWGTYPFVTASGCLPAGITAGAGIPAQAITDVVAVTKAYTTRVGAGPFPTHLTDENGQKLQQIGHEFGTTTGRSRDCGWLDLEMLKFCIQINGVTRLALTKVDVLDDFAEIKVCVGYEFSGKKVHYLDCDATTLQKVKPVYKTFKGWKTSTRLVRKFDDLPAPAKKYISFLEKELGVPATYISVGPDRDETIIRK